MSPITRIVCGVLGLGGAVAIFSGAYTNNGFDVDFALISGMVALFVFLYAAIFGVLPWGLIEDRDNGESRMSQTKWRMFWGASIAFLLTATAYLAAQGVFENADLVVLVIVGILFAIVGVAMYLYIRDHP